MLACGHDDATGTFGVCAHVLAGEAYRERFLGRGIDCDLVCKNCVEAVVDGVCRTCRDRAVAERDNDGYLGKPGILEEPSTLWLEHLPPIQPRVASLLDLRALPGADRDLWLGVTAHRELVELDLDRDEVRVIASLPEMLYELGTYEGLGEHAPRTPPPLRLHVSRDGTLAAIVQERHGVRGLVVELATGAHLLELIRDGYHPEHCTHSFAFVEHAGRTLVVHATTWNRLDVRDPRTGELLTPRGPTSYGDDRTAPPHYLDYFHCGLAVSPGQRRIVDNGWVWQPVGVIYAWRVDDWLTTNVFESEDGPSKKELGWADMWDLPLCWLDDDMLAIWGYGQEQNPLDAVRIIDAATGTRVRWFAGPAGELVFDRVLVALGMTGTTVWNLESGTRLLADPSPSPTRYHPTAKTFVRFDGATIHRSRLRGLDASFRSGAIADLADRIAREKAFDDLPVLGDALEAAGCTDREMLDHCQHPGEHGDRCWVLDRLDLLRARS
jgi:hypothetical protein